jgi:hypothetical protein
MRSSSLWRRTLELAELAGSFWDKRAKQVKSVTAIDPSKGMLECLQENMEKEGVKNSEITSKTGIGIKSYPIFIVTHP